MGSYLTAILSFLSAEGPKLIPVAVAVAAAITAVAAKNYSQAWTDILSILTILGAGGSVAVIHAQVAALRAEVKAATAKPNVAGLTRP